MNLTTDNTAIVLDSTSDYPEAPSRFPNMRVRPAVRALRRRDVPRLRRAGIRRVLREAPHLARAPRDLAADAAGLRHDLREPRRLRAHLLAAHLRDDVRDVPERASWRRRSSAATGSASSTRETASLAIAMLAHAMQRRLARGTTDVELAALVERFQRDIGVVFTVETLEYLQRGGRIGRAAALAGSLLNVRPILAINDGEVVAVARVRGRQKALAEFERRFDGGDGGQARPADRDRARGRAGMGRHALRARVARPPEGGDRVHRAARRRRQHARRPRHGRLLLAPRRLVRKIGSLVRIPIARRASGRFADATREELRHCNSAGRPRDL